MTINEMLGLPRGVVGDALRSNVMAMLAGARPGDVTEAMATAAVDSVLRTLVDVSMDELEFERILVATTQALDVARIDARNSASHPKSKL